MLQYVLSPVDGAGSYTFTVVSSLTNNKKKFTAFPEKVMKHFYLKKKRKAELSVVCLYSCSNCSIIVFHFLVFCETASLRKENVKFADCRLLHKQQVEGWSPPTHKKVRVSVSIAHGFNYSIPASAQKEGDSLPVRITAAVKHEQMFSWIQSLVYS